MKQPSSDHHQHGAYLPILCAVVLAVLTVIGLATDAGNIFLTQLRLQKAVDSGVISAMLQARSSDSSVLKTAAENFIVANMRTSSIYYPLPSDGKPASLIEVTAADGEITARASTPARTFMLHNFFSSLADYAEVFANASGGARRVAVALVLDESGSMNQTQPCPATSACHNAGACTKACLLKEATRSFIQALDDTDYIALIGFNDITTRDYADGHSSTGTRVLHPLASCSQLSGNHTCRDQRASNPLTGSGRTIDQLSAKGDTCISCGLNLARNLFDTTSLPASTARYVVLMSDGAPTASPDDPPPGTYQCGYGSFGTWQSPQYCEKPLVACTIRHTFSSIIQSDQLRMMSKPVTVMGVGLGNPGEGWCINQASDNPPFQTCADGWDSYTRPYLFRRLTNSIQSSDPPFLVTNAAYQSHAECIPRTGSQYPEGTYLETNDANQLTTLFGQLFERIKTPRLHK